MSRKLTKKEKKFCKLYFKTRDRVHTKLVLGYDIDISKKHIRNFIQSKPVTKDFQIDINPILRRYYAIATFDHTSMYDKNGDIKPWKCLSDEQKMAIKTYRENTDGSVSYTVYNQTMALDKIYAHKMKQDESINSEDDSIEIKIKIDPRSKVDNEQ